MGIDTFLRIRSSQLQLLMFTYQEPYYIIRSERWQMMKKNVSGVIYVLLGEVGLPFPELQLFPNYLEN